MTKLAAISRADLLRFILSSQGLDDMTAELLGYERISSSPAPDMSVFLTAAAEDSQPDEIPSERPDEPELEFPATKPRFQFLMPMRATTLKSESPDQSIGNPISDAELAIPWQERGLPLQPLVPWSRLAPYLRNRLGTQMTGARVDVRRLIRMISSGKPLTELPREKRTAWAPQSVILRDDTPEMFPFRQDVHWLLDRLNRERGSGGMSLITIKEVPRIEDIASIVHGTPILVISAMGQLDGNPATQSAWLRLNRWLSMKEYLFHALSPCPRNRWQPQSVGDWKAVVWDRGHRLPRRGGMSAQPRTESGKHTTDRLLDLLAPASLIGSPLLRAARLLLGRPADIGTEWDAWHHSDCWHSVSSFGFEPGFAYDRRLQRRTRIAGGDSAALVAEIGDVIRSHHATCSQTIAAEAELRDCLSSTSDADAIQRVKGLLQRVVDRLRLLAIQPGSNEGEVCGLSDWCTEMVERLSPGMRQNAVVDELIAQCLALAHTWQRVESIVLPDGVNSEVYAEESRRAAMRVRDSGVPLDYVLGLEESGMSIVPADHEAKATFPIGRIRSAGHGRLHVDVREPSPAHHNLQLKGDTRSGISFDTMPTKFRVDSTHIRLEFEAIGRPAWADRLWYDQYGLAAEFTIRDVVFILRWIPPGLFLMGSPETEVGRFDRDELQHEVTISSGFWLGETPVTQAQWVAVVDSSLDQPDFWKAVVPADDVKRYPSRFRGTANIASHPVETVTWYECNTFCQLIMGLIPDGPAFRLPTEAEWEYACRSGTQSAYNDGSSCTIPKGIDPALHQLGWFSQNIRAMTNQVRRKLPNAWGLYDMHGNVLEWCADSWDATIYQSRSGNVADPVNLKGENPNRIARGGGWGTSADGCRAAARWYSDADRGCEAIGFRLASVQRPRSVLQPPWSRG